MAISSTLIERVTERDNVHLFEHRVAVDLILQEHDGPDGPEKRCCGAYVHNIQTGETDVILARSVVLATGGASKVYLYTSNPDVATGDGIAMAWRAGCRVGNMEFMQFHPTCLYHPKAKSFLITEAIRGEGGRLLLPNGERFMPRFDERAELAPRDVVARAIDHEMKRLGADCLYLDISHKPADFIIEHFPTVYAKCLQLGLDITRDPIPVVPAAHYTCGGVIIDQHGRTDVPGLYALGETSFTGLHGANRMASNSLLECFVYGQAVADDIGAHLAEWPAPREAAEWDDSQVTDSDEDVVISHNWDELRRFMWDYVGIVRTVKRLERAQHRVELLKSEITEYYSNYHISNDLLELRNLVVIADLIIRSALQRRESRGCISCANSRRRRSRRAIPFWCLEGGLSITAASGSGATGPDTRQVRPCSSFPASLPPTVRPGRTRPGSSEEPSAPLLLRGCRSGFSRDRAVMRPPPSLSRLKPLLHRSGGLLPGNQVPQKVRRTRSWSVGAGVGVVQGAVLIGIGQGVQERPGGGQIVVALGGVEGRLHLVVAGITAGLAARMRASATLSGSGLRPSRSRQRRCQSRKAS